MTARIVLIEGNAGYEVVAAEDVISGGQAILRAPTDLILCDVELPYLDGYEFVAALKQDEQTRDIPVVFLTGRDDIDEHAARLGAAAYLRKPLMVDRLLDIVSLYTK